VKASEKRAKEALRNNHKVNGNEQLDHVVVVGKRGAHIEYNQGQAVKQKRGSGLRDIAAHLRGGKKK
jgi:hypothetical protein